MEGKPGMRSNKKMCSYTKSSVAKKVQQACFPESSSIGVLKKTDKSL